MNLENKEMDQSLETLISPVLFFLVFFFFLAEFPSGMWKVARPTNFAQASKIRTGKPGRCLWPI